jgi:hypothetical protein
MGIAVFIGVLVFIAIAYLLSLRIHPWRACRACRGTGRHHGSVFTYSHRQCLSCGGNGRRARLGVHVFHRGALTWAERGALAAQHRRGRNLGR